MSLGWKSVEDLLCERLVGLLQNTHPGAHLASGQWSPLPMKRNSPTLLIATPVNDFLLKGNATVAWCT